ncbi:MAG TPA: hypothetical protein VMV17_21820, partial [Streptosporangiaceae bacterium]|nr:hypothetical protein [Streptosporangiaceae bacterium]
TRLWACRTIAQQREPACSERATLGQGWREPSHASADICRQDPGDLGELLVVAQFARGADALDQARP